MSDVSLPDGGHLSIAVRGAGPPLLLVRPLGGSLASWEPFADELVTRLRVMMFDPRGTGCSSAAPLATSTRSMARDALAVLEALGVERAHVYGLSLGGMVASWLAIDAPERVGALVLASTPAHGLAAARDLGRHLWMMGCLPRPVRAAEACLATRILSPAFRRSHPDAVARIRARATARPASRRGLVTLLAAAARHDVRSRLGDVRAATLVVGGARDTLLPLAEQARLAERLPRGRFAAVEAGHDVSAEAPRAVAELVRRHVEG